MAPFAAEKALRSHVGEGALGGHETLPLGHGVAFIFSAGHTDP